MKRSTHRSKEAGQSYHDRLRDSSIILNKTARLKSDRVVNFNDRKDLKKLLSEVEEKQKKMALSLLEVAADEKHSKELQKRTGHKVEVTERLKQQRRHAEAAECVVKEEIEKLNKLIDTGSIEKNNTLRYGCKGIGIIKDGTLKVLDGQSIKPRNGHLYIQDSRSIYNGISVTDYNNRIQRPWKLATGKLQAAKLSLQRKLTMQGEDVEVIESLWKKKEKQMFIDDPELKKLFAIKPKGCPSIPDPKLAKS